MFISQMRSLWNRAENFHSNLYVLETFQKKKTLVITTICCIIEDFYKKKTDLTVKNIFSWFIVLRAIFFINCTFLNFK